MDYTGIYSRSPASNTGWLKYPNRERNTEPGMGFVNFFCSWPGSHVGLCFATRQKMEMSGISSVPLSYWIAGALGAFYVTVIVLAFPKIGAALTFGLIVAGQLTIAIVLDHFKILVQQQHGINIYRIIGLLLIVSGVILIRKF